ncbi:MAG: TspO/MBR family protein [Candidatus Micrarchaeota archaeon]
MNWKMLGIAILIPLLVGFVGSYFTISSVNTWYSTLEKPSFNPPSWLFGPVWTLLYILMGVAFYLVWIAKKNKTAISLYSVQLGLNLLWSVLFFGLRSPIYGLICIIALWLSIVATMLAFYRVSKTATYLMIPYLLWVSFASVLNYWIFALNGL